MLKDKRILKMKLAVFICILFSIYVLSVFVSSQSLPSDPSWFWGTVTMDGSSAPVGTVVSAWINGSNHPNNFTVAVEGWYGSMSITQGGENDTILFKIN